MLVIIMAGNIRKGLITFISRVAMIDGGLVVEEIVIIVISSSSLLMALNSLHWPLAFFGVGFGECRTVSNVPELPELSH
jgi:hypothetical protein